MLLRIETQLFEAPLTPAEMAEQTRIANVLVEKFRQRTEVYAKRKQAEARENARPAPIQGPHLFNRARWIDFVCACPPGAVSEFR